jgi:hypothetical protein
MTPKSKNHEKATTTMAKRAERIREAVLAMQDYRSHALATLANAERLRALRLAKEESHAPNAKKPTQKRRA